MRTQLDTKLRSQARFSLYTSLALVGTLLAVSAPFLHLVFEPPTEDYLVLDPLHATAEPTLLLQRYLRINTAQPNADELAGAEFLAGVLREAGIPATIEALGGGHANLFALLEGESPEALVLHNHIDTDPVKDGHAWTHPPFGGEIELPYLYGRGAFDMKSIAIAQLEAMIDLKRSGRRLRRSVLYLATGSEEVGSDLGTKWILRNHPELARRFWAFLTEGGTLETRSLREPKYWGIEFAQKHFASVVLCSEHRERLEELRTELIEELTAGDLGVRVTPEMRAYLASYSESREDEEIRAALDHPERLALDAETYFSLPRLHRAMFRDEAHAFPVEADPGGGWRMLVKLHLLPGSNLEEVRQRLLPAWRTWGLDQAVWPDADADHGSPLDGEVFTALSEEIAAAHPRAPVGPWFLIFSATDARFARTLGIPAYGFSPFFIDTMDSFHVGSLDERIYLPSFLEGVEIYRKVVARLAGGEG